MVDKKVPRIIFAIITFPLWYSYYSFLHNYVRTCDICIDTFRAIPSTLWKILFTIFMYCCGFPILYCILCMMGMRHLCLGEPCKKFQSAETNYEAFHHLVYEQSCETEGTIRNKLGEIFKR